MNTEQFIQDIIDESEYEIENASWWMSQEAINMHHYPTPIGYQQIYPNEIINHEEKQDHLYPTPKQLNQPLVLSSDNEYNLNDENNVISNIDENDNDLLIEPIHYELQLIYKKLLFSSIIAFFICLLTLIGGLFFYKLKGIILNIIVIFATMFGIFCGFYNEHKAQKKAIQKLKYLLIYFVICCIFSIIIFFIEIIYLILLPINNWPNINNNIHFNVLCGIFIFFFGGIIFWMILVLFYIDLVSRACLKRGRIGFIISQFNKENNIKQSDNNHGGDEFNKLQNNSFWIKIFALIIWFRCRFRNIRRGLTQMTGIDFLKLKPILSMRNIHNKQQLIDNNNNNNNNKEHEEEKLKAILEEGGTMDIIYGPKFMNKFHIFSKDCFSCNDHDDNRNDIEGNNNNQTNYCLSVGVKTLCIFVLFYIFLPLFVLIICILLISIPGMILFNVIQLICDCNYNKCINIKTMYHIISICVGFVCWIYLWFWMICTNPKINGNWNWNTQCNMWNYSMFVFVRSIIKATTAPIFN